MNNSNFLKRAGASCALVFAAMASHAGPILWVNTFATNSQLVTVDVATGASTVIGSAGTQLTDIAFSTTGDLYGISFANLFKISQSTGAATLIGGLGTVSGFSNALVFGADGTLYMAGDRLYSINTSTGASTAIGSGIGYQSGGDLAFIGGNLFMATQGNELVNVNITTGVGSLVGTLGVAGMFGLASPDNVTLYGVAGQSVYSVNAGTGAATFQSSFNPTVAGVAGGLAFRTEAGAGSNVPEPATLALVGLALLGMAAGRRRAKTGR